MKPLQRKSILHHPKKTQLPQPSVQRCLGLEVPPRTPMHPRSGPLSPMHRLISQHLSSSVAAVTASSRMDHQPILAQAHSRDDLGSNSSEFGHEVHSTIRPEVHVISGTDQQTRQEMVQQGSRPVHPIICDDHWWLGTSI